MISDADTGFPPPADGEVSWAETNCFGFSVPEAGLVGVVYALARQPLGCMSVEVQVSGGVCDGEPGR